jgi:hypothetical protein
MRVLIQTLVNLHAGLNSDPSQSASTKIHGHGSKALKEGVPTTLEFYGCGETADASGIDEDFTVAIYQDSATGSPIFSQNVGSPDSKVDTGEVSGTAIYQYIVTITGAPKLKKNKQYYYVIYNENPTEGNAWKIAGIDVSGSPTPDQNYISVDSGVFPPTNGSSGSGTNLSLVVTGIDQYSSSSSSSIDIFF